MPMNLKKITTKLNSLKTEKEKIEIKKADVVKGFDTQIEFLNAQISKYESFKKNIEKLQKQLEQQLDMAEEFAAGEKKDSKAMQEEPVERGPETSEESADGTHIPYPTVVFL